MGGRVAPHSLGGQATSHAGWALLSWSSLFFNREASGGRGTALRGGQQAWVRGVALGPLLCDLRQSLPLSELQFPPW